MRDREDRNWTTRPPEERRDFNAAEIAMIRKGDRPGAKAAWHKRKALEKKDQT